MLRIASARYAMGTLPSLRQQLFKTSRLPVLRGFAAGAQGAPPLPDDTNDGRIMTHFRLSSRPHPLKGEPLIKKEEKDNLGGKHFGYQQNHIWTDDEIQELMEHGKTRHQPQTMADRIARMIMTTAYHSFNFITGYKKVNTPVKSIEYRLIILESFAGVPGFVAAGFRHFRSLRRLQRDHGWIYTLLEEAENERMHLLVCLKMFEAGMVTRSMVILAQGLMSPLLAAVYAVNPKAVHRFVGYLEETAVYTYADIIAQVETPGTPLHDAWSQLPAPEIAKNYWHLPDESKWVDALRAMFADECHHRDVNHTFATMKSDDPNPFVEKHREDAIRAWQLEQMKEQTEAQIRKAKA